MANRGAAEAEMIASVVEPADVAEWRALYVESPKYEPSPEEKEALKTKKKAEAKGKKTIQDRVSERLAASGKPKVKEEKIKKFMDKVVKELDANESAAATRAVINLKPPEGTRDFAPAEMRLKNWLLGEMRATAEEFGFHEYDAPVLERAELYTRKGGDEILEQMYSFKDKSGCEVTLRPEMTPTLARMVLNQTNLATGAVSAAGGLPLKWYSIPQCWRFETCQRGRNKEHYQWNCDIVGEKSITAELELLAVICRFFSRLGVTSDMIGVRVNSRKVLDVALKKAGVDKENFDSICIEIDKFDKRGEAAVRATLMAEPLNLPESTVETIMQCMKSKTVEELGVAVGDPDLEAVKELGQLFELAKSYGIGDYLEFNASVVRGLSYYTGIVFEAFAKKSELRAIAGGGRYDTLIEKYGSAACQIPCCGFGFGDAVIVELLREHNLMPTLGPSVDFVVAPWSANEQAAACQVAAALRAAGFSVDLALVSKKAHLAFDLANRAGARRVAFVGPDEWSKGLVRVKDLLVKDPQTNEGLQLDIPFADIAHLDAKLKALALSKGAVWPDVKEAAAPAPSAPSSRSQVDSTPDAAGLRMNSTAKFAVLAAP